MSTPTIQSVFARQFRYWSLHCFLNALPSYCIALIYLKLWKSPPAMLAMTGAVVTFVFLYSILTSVVGPLSRQANIFSRALKLGTRIRGWISLISLPVLFSDKVVMFVPDLWCGMLAAGLVNQVSGRTLNGNASSWLEVYGTTLVEGLILSFLLLLISFFALIFINANDRRKAFSRAIPGTATQVSKLR
jgi:hypothetical protein